MSAVCCDLWNVDIPALEAKTKEVLTSNGIEPPAFIFALGDSLNDYCIFKESKRECLQYFIQSADKDSIKIFRQKKIRNSSGVINYYHMPKMPPTLLI